MLKIYDGEVFIIELEEFRERTLQTLKNIVKNPDCYKMVFLLKKAGRTVAATSLNKFLDNSIISHAFSDNGGGYS